MRINVFKTTVILSCVLLASCFDREKNIENKDGDWIKDEILLQLSALRKDVKSLKADIAKLDSKVKVGNAGGRKVPQAPKQVKWEKR